MSVFGPVERMIGRALRPLRLRLNNAIRRAVVDVVNDAPMIAEIQASVMSDELQDKIENFEHYGFTSRWPAGTEFVLVRIGASGDHQVAVASAYRNADPTKQRPRLPAVSDVALWDNRGQSVKLIDTKIVIEPEPGGTIELGEGATKAVARVGDTITLSAAMATWINAVSLAIPVTAPTDQDGAIVTGSAVVSAVD